MIHLPSRKPKDPAAIVRNVVRSETVAQRRKRLARIANGEPIGLKEMICTAAELQAAGVVVFDHLGNEIPQIMPHQQKEAAE